MIFEREVFLINHLSILNAICEFKRETLKIKVWKLYINGFIFLKIDTLAFSISKQRFLQ
jgi:hypothetical protein